jgi:hypothetical protein
MMTIEQELEIENGLISVSQFVCFVARTLCVLFEFLLFFSAVDGDDVSCCNKMLTPFSMDLNFFLLCPRIRFQYPSKKIYEVDLYFILGSSHLCK